MTIVHPSPKQNATDEQLNKLSPSPHMARPSLTQKTCSVSTCGLPLYRRGSISACGNGHIHDAETGVVIWSV